MRRLLAIIAAALTFSLFTQASAAPPVSEVKVINIPLPVTVPGVISIKPPATFFEVVTPSQAFGGSAAEVVDVTISQDSLLQTVDIQVTFLELFQGACIVRLFRNPAGQNQEFLFRQFLEDGSTTPIFAANAANISVAPGVSFLAGDTLRFSVLVEGPFGDSCIARGSLFFAVVK